MKNEKRTSSLKNGLQVGDRFFVCFFIIFCVGIIIGATISGKTQYGSDSAVFKIWQQNFALINEKSIFLSFVHNLLSCITYLLLVYSLGVCAVGSLFLPVSCLAIGVGKGVFFGFLCLKGSILEYAYALVFMIVQNLVFCFTILLLMCLSLRMSIQTFSHFTNRIYTNLKPVNFKKYNQWYIIAFCVLALNSFLDAVLMRFY